MVINLGRFTTGYLEVAAPRTVLGREFINNVGRITNDMGTARKIVALELWVSAFATGSVLFRSSTVVQIGTSGRFDFTQALGEIGWNHEAHATRLIWNDRKVWGDWSSTLFELENFESQQLGDASEKGQLFINIQSDTHTSGAVNESMRIVLNAYYKG